MTYDEFTEKYFPLIPKLNIIAGTPNHTRQKILDAISKLGISEYLDYFTVMPETYLKWVKNQHHWTTRFVWYGVFPIVMDFLGLKFRRDDFVAVPFEFNGNNITYHKFIKPVAFAFKNYDHKYDLLGNHDTLRDIDGKKINTKALTHYHRLFIGAHTNCHIFNLSHTSQVRVFLNADSMCIPLIPLIAPYVNEILVVDNHNKTMLPDIIQKFNPTHYLMVNSSLNIISGNSLDKMVKFEL